MDKVAPSPEDGEPPKRASPLLQKKKRKFVYARLNLACWIIILHELLERFSFYGMKGLLSIFLNEYLGFSSNETTSIYHLFSALAYLMPVVGALISDNYWGRYKTVLIFGIVYFIGHLIIPLSTIVKNKAGPLVGMFILAIGTGIIKPCVAAFGGDQTPDDDEEATEAFFSIFYLSINVGAFVSQLLTPILKESVKCIDNQCYPLAFGVPAGAFFITYIIFVAAKPIYRFLPNEENVFVRMCQMVKHAFSRRGKLRKTGDNRESVLDYADDKYPQTFIRDVKIVLSVLILYLPFPLFWALFDQQGSRWSLQASQMDGTITKDVQIYPEQMQMVNPLLIVLIIPLFNNIVYPLLTKCNLLTKPPSRMVAGYVLAAISFVYAGLLQFQIDKALIVPELAAAKANVHFLNVGQCKLTITPPGQSAIPLNAGMFGPQTVLKAPANVSLKLTSNCGGTSLTETVVVALAEKSNYTLSVAALTAPLNGSSFSIATPTQYRNVVGGKGFFKFVMSPDLTKAGGYLAVSGKDIKEKVVLNASGSELFPSILQSDYIGLKNGDYKLVYREGDESKELKKFSFVTGEVQILAVWNSTKERVIEIREFSLPLISMFLQLPQYVIMTMGEVLFSVTSMTFAYSEAPPSMKSILQSLYLVTIFFGNIIVTIVALLPSLPSQAWEFLLFAGLVLIAGFVNAILAWRFNKNKAKRLAAEQQSKENEKDVNEDENEQPVTTL